MKDINNRQTAHEDKRSNHLQSKMCGEIQSQKGAEWMGERFAGPVPRLLFDDTAEPISAPYKCCVFIEYLLQLNLLDVADGRGKNRNHHKNKQERGRVLYLKTAHSPDLICKGQK